MAQVLMVYRSSVREWTEVLAGYFAGLAVALAMRSTPGVPHVASIGGFVACVFLAPLVDTWWLARVGAVLPTKEIVVRRRQDAARSNFLLTVLAYALGFVILVGTIDVIIPEDPIAETLAYNWEHPWLYSIMVFGGLGLGVIVARRQGRFAECLTIPSQEAVFVRRERNRYWFDLFAVAMVGIGFVSSAYLYHWPGLVHPLFGISVVLWGAVPATSGVVTSLTLLILNRILPVTNTELRRTALASTLARAAAMGALYWGIPMATLGALVEIAVSTNVGTSRGGDVVVEQLAFLSQLLPLTCAMAVTGGVLFGLSLGLFLWLVTRLSTQTGRRDGQSSPPED